MCNQLILSFLEKAYVKEKKRKKADGIKEEEPWNEIIYIKHDILVNPLE